jgi:Flp pilus assembly protein TadD
MPAFLRGACLLLPLFATACSTFPSGEARVGVTAMTYTAGRPTPPADAVKDDLGLGKMHFENGNYGLAELHFRRAVEETPGEAEGWLGLAASYDQMKRWPLADRAYAQALKITGPTPAVLNNRGYSYMLRGDVRRASQDLSVAAAQDPENEQIRNNLQTLDSQLRKRL